MWPALIAAARAYAPILVFPFAFTIGVIGYNLESAVSDKHTPWKESVIDRREKRKLEESDQQEDSFKVPETIFDRSKKKEVAE